MTEKITYSKEENHEFKTLSELGKTNIYGFILEKIWDTLPESDFSIKPDFNGESFDFIYESYERACKKTTLISFTLIGADIFGNIGLKL